MKRVYWVLICIVMILSLFGCGDNETGLPDKDLPADYEYPTTGSDSYADKSSAEPTTDSDSNIDKSSTESKENEDTAVQQTEIIPSMDELLRTPHKLDFDDENNISYGYLPNYDDSENYRQITSISVVNKHTLNDGKIVFDEENILTYGYRRVGDVLYVATTDAIWRVTPDEKTIIYDAAGNISAMEASKHIILFVENGILKAMRLDGTEQRDILYIGDITQFEVCKTTQLTITKRYYNGQILSMPEYQKILEEQYPDLHGSEAVEYKSYFQSEVVPAEFFILDIGEDNPQLKQVTENEQHKWSSISKMDN